VPAPRGGKVEAAKSGKGSIVERMAVAAKCGEHCAKLHVHAR